MRIFIVDDEEIACFGLKGMMGRIFGAEENEIYAFTSSVKALSEAERLRPELIFLDITMPEINGIAFTEKIKQVYSPEIIVISGNDDYNYVRQCFKLNVRDYLLKPIEFDELKKLLYKFKTDLSGEEATAKQETYTPSLPFVFTAVVKCRDVKDEFKNLVLEIKTHPSIKGKMEIVGNKERYNDLIFTFYFDDKFDYYRAVREFERLFELLADSTGTVVKGAYSSLYTWDKYEDAQREMFTLLQSRLYSDKSICYSQQNKVIRETNDNQEFYSQISLLPESFSLDYSDKFITFVSRWFVKERLQYLSYKTLKKQYESIIGRIVNNSELGDGLEIRNFREFNTIGEMIFEIKRVIDGISNYYIESNQDDKSVIELALKFINENYMKNITLATVSNHYNLNYSYFSRIFKDFIGISFSQYLLKIRMEKAKELLLSDPELKISDIATLVGYSGDNVQNFTRAFKNHFGKSPKNYKN